MQRGKVNLCEKHNEQGKSVSELSGVSKYFGNKGNKKN